MKSLYFVLVIILSGCATSRPVYTASGLQGHSINCDGTALSWGACYAKAGEICREKGFEILSKSGDTGGMVSGTRSIFVGGSIITRNMVIQCKQ